MHVLESVNRNVDFAYPHLGDMTTLFFSKMMRVTC